MAIRTYPCIAIAGSPQGIVVGTVALAAGVNGTPIGFASCGLGGTTANRPKIGDGDIPNGPRAGEHYLDTSLNAVVVWDGQNWRNRCS